MKLSTLRVYSVSLFVFGFFQHASAVTVAPILIFNMSDRVIQRKDVPFGGPVNDAPIKGVKFFKNLPKKGLNRQFPAKS